MYFRSTFQTLALVIEVKILFAPLSACPGWQGQKDCNGKLARTPNLKKITPLPVESSAAL